MERWQEGFGSVCCGPRCCGSVRNGSVRFDTILGESIVETAMVTPLHTTRYERLIFSMLFVNAYTLRERQEHSTRYRNHFLRRQAPEHGRAVIRFNLFVLGLC